MAFRNIGVALALTALPAAGCGTVSNLVRPGPEEGGKAPFGGVKHDLWYIRQAADGEHGGRARPASEPGHYPPAALVAACAADLPLSLIGDLVTWPYTVAYTCINRPVPVPPVLHAAPPVFQAAPPFRPSDAPAVDAVKPPTTDRVQGPPEARPAFPRVPPRPAGPPPGMGGTP